MSAAGNFVIERAAPRDIDELLRLYFVTYGLKYPLALGTDREVMGRIIASPSDVWLVTREPDAGKIVGSAVVETDGASGIGKLSGVVVHPDYRKQSIAQNMIAHATARLLAAEGTLNSIYTTTRTLALGPQLMCLHDGFEALGIFPNAHKIEHYETLTLLAKYRDGVLQRRKPIPHVPEKLAPMVTLLERVAGLPSRVEVLPDAPKRKRSDTRGAHEFELILAPKFVKNRFAEVIRDPYDRFYPFHDPNLLIVGERGKVEIYAYLSKVDRYCALIGSNVPVSMLADRLDGLLDQMSEYGISYTEALMALDRTESIQTLLDFCFLPSAIYPAMRKAGDQFVDFVVMSRTMEPLDFRRMTIDRQFKPFVDQYVDLWKRMYLDTLEIFDGHT